MAINDLMVPQQPMQQEPPQDAVQQEQPQQPQQPADNSNVTPEEQEAYERVVLSGIKILSDPKANSSIMTMLSNEDVGEPEERLAKVASAIFSQIDEKSGGKIPEGVIIHSAGEILENVAEFANEAGVIQVDSQVQNKASQHLMMAIGEEYDIDPDEIQQVMSEMSDQDLQAVRQEQEGAVGQTQAAPQQPAQQLPGIINQQIGT